ncbi:DUF4167 domain-containing protein [Rhodoblastus acidophilus]|nr:DUF4167 domain-containing protein [Rhodoblastus acidophilus]
MRGRNNRKGPNPLTRTYESNGPDVKIRGTAQHITEKYLQLARDAQASGDTVVAENYLQHAEHYYRIIASAQAAQAQAQMGFGRVGEELDEVDEDDDFIAMPDRFASPFERSQPNVLPGPAGQGQPINPMGMGQQPYLDRPAFTGEFMDRQGNGERGDRPERQDRQERQGQQDRPERQERPPQERPPQDRQDRQDRPNRNDRRFNAQGERGERAPSGRGRFRDQPRFEPAPESREQPDVDFGAMSALPAFITAPVRPVAPAPAVEPEQPSAEPAFAPPPEAPVEAAAAPAAPEAPAGAAPEEGEGQFHLRPRPRRRRTAAVRAEEAPAESGPTEAPEASSAE